MEGARLSGRSPEELLSTRGKRAVKMRSGRGPGPVAAGGEGAGGSEWVQC